MIYFWLMVLGVALMNILLSSIEIIEHLKEKKAEAVSIKHRDNKDKND